jgi:hypothetical protein
VPQLEIVYIKVGRYLTYVYLEEMMHWSMMLISSLIVLTFISRGLYDGEGSKSSARDCAYLDWQQSLAHLYMHPVG